MFNPCKEHDDWQVVAFEQWQLDQYNVPSPRPIAICNQCGASVAWRGYGAIPTAFVPKRQYSEFQVFTAPFDMSTLIEENHGDTAISS